MKEQFLDFNTFWNEFLKFSKDNNFNDEEILKWITVKSLRLKRNQFDYIKNIETSKFENMKNALLKYINGKSLGEIYGYIEFYGNYFDVTENVFDPRLSTESLITAILKLNKTLNKDIKILDLCTGSGCIAITLAKHLNVKVEAVDISPLALEIATKNAKNIGADVDFIEFDLSKNWNLALNKKYDIIVSNPPYWNADKILSNQTTIKGNPLIGFDGGDDGLDIIKLIINNSYNFINNGGYIFLEMDPDQEEKITELLKNAGFENIKTEKDYRNITRVIYAQKI